MGEPVDLERKALTRHPIFGRPSGLPWRRYFETRAATRMDILLDRLPGIRYGEDNTFVHQPGIMLGTWH